MILYHATRRENLNSILGSGLDPSYSRGKIPAVWAVSCSKIHWAVLHCLRRHGGRAQNVVVLEVQVSDEDWKRQGLPGLWFCRERICPARIIKVLEFDDYSESPVKEI